VEKKETKQTALTRKVDPEFIKSTFEKIKRDKQEVLAWKIVGSQKETARLELAIIRPSEKELVFKVLPSFMLKLEKIVSGSDYVSFLVSESSNIFQAKIKQHKEEGYLTVEMPKTIAVIEKRKIPRIIIEPKMDVTASFYLESLGGDVQNNRFAKMQCFDISVSGTSFVVTKVESKSFKKGDIINNFSIKIKGNDISGGKDLIVAQVVNIVPFETINDNQMRYSAQKIGLKFEKISARAKKAIDVFIFQYLKKQLDAMKSSS